MTTWKPTNTCELATISDDELEELVERELVRVTTRRPRVSIDVAARCVRDAGLTNEVPARWTRW